jgi:hypothetical protein
MFHIKCLAIAFISSTLYFTSIFLYLKYLKRSYILGEERVDDDESLTLRKRKMKLEDDLHDEERRPSAPYYNPSSSIEEPEDYHHQHSLPYKKTQV